MILGFSHVAINTDNVRARISELEKKDFTLIESYVSLPSHPSKTALLNRETKNHDIHLLSGPYNIEVVSHHNGARVANSRYSLQSNHIEVQTNCFESEKLFFQNALGFEEMSPRLLTLSSKFSTLSVSIRLETSSQNLGISYLDDEGVTCMAFLTTNLDQDIEVLIAEGATYITEKFDMVIGKRRFLVAMGRSPSGLIFELLSVLR